MSLALEIDWKATNVNNKLSKKALTAAGTDCDGSAIYVGRASYNDTGNIPVKFIPDRQRAYVCKFLTECENL